MATLLFILATQIQFSNELFHFCIYFNCMWLIKGWLLQLSILSLLKHILCFNRRVMYWICIHVLKEREDMSKGTCMVCRYQAKMKRKNHSLVVAAVKSQVVSIKFMAYIHCQKNKKKKNRILCKAWSLCLHRDLNIHTCINTCIHTYIHTYIHT